MKLFFAAPLSGLPSDPIALGAQVSRLAFRKKSGSRSSGELAAVFSDRLALARSGRLRRCRTDCKRR
jgi:hypothetical protein